MHRFTLDDVIALFTSDFVYKYFHVNASVFFAKLFVIKLLGKRICYLLFKICRIIIGIGFFDTIGNIADCSCIVALDCVFVKFIVKNKLGAPSDSVKETIRARQSVIIFS